jgi:hypothetical protein
VVAHGDALDAGTDPLDDSSRLVAEHDGQRMRDVAAHEVVIAVAHSVGDPPHLDFVGTGIQELDFFDHQRLLHLVQNGGGRFHTCLLTSFRSFRSV